MVVVSQPYSSHPVTHTQPPTQINIDPPMVVVSQPCSSHPVTHTQPPTHINIDPLMVVVSQQCSSHPVTHTQPPTHINIDPHMVVVSQPCSSDPVTHTQPHTHTRLPHTSKWIHLWLYYRNHVIASTSHTQTPTDIIIDLPMVVLLQPRYSGPSSTPNLQHTSKWIRLWLYYCNHVIAAPSLTLNLPQTSTWIRLWLYYPNHAAFFLYIIHPVIFRNLIWTRCQSLCYT